MGFREAGVLSSGDKSLAACASKLPVIIGMVSADHTEVGERVLQPRQQRREQWGALCNGGNRLAGSAEARRGEKALNVDCKQSVNTLMLASPELWTTIGCEIEVLVP